MPLSRGLTSGGGSSESAGVSLEPPVTLSSNCDQTETHWRHTTLPEHLQRNVWRDSCWYQGISGRICPTWRSSGTCPASDPSTPRQTARHHRHRHQPLPPDYPDRPPPERSPAQTRGWWDGRMHSWTEEMIVRLSLSQCGNGWVTFRDLRSRLQAAWSDQNLRTI